jgi:phage baseplate assembly protein W
VAIKDKIKKPFIEDRDTDIYIGIDLPIRKSLSTEGYFASTSTTIEAVKNNIRNLLNTHQGERLMQPSIGIDLKRYLFEPISSEIILQIQNSILDLFEYWLPFVEVHDIQVFMNNNTLSVKIVFNIKQDPNTLESVQIDVVATDNIDTGGDNTGAY